MSNTITGTIKVISPEVKVSDSFKKREFVLTDNTSSKYAQYIQLQLVQNNCDLINGLSVGDEVTAHFNINGREWQSPSGEIKYFNTLTVWKIDTISKAAVSTTTALDDFMNAPEPEPDSPF